MDMRAGEKLTEDFQRKKLAELLAECTTEQQAFFGRLYPDGVKADRLCWAITQCVNTLEKAKQPLPT